MIESFISEKFRIRLENLSKVMTKNPFVQVVFSQNTCTDGTIIELNPEIYKYYQEDTFEKMCEAFQIQPKLEVIIRYLIEASCIHEVAHLIFSNFKVLSYIQDETELENDMDKHLIHSIFNIIEDAFVENAICALFEGSHKYIWFSNKLAYENRKPFNDSNSSDVNIFLEYFTQKTILRKTKGKLSEVNKDIVKTIKKCEPLFAKGSFEINAMQRYAYAKEIYNIIREDFDIYSNDKDDDLSFNGYSSLPSSNEDFDYENGQNEEFSNQFVKKLKTLPEFSNEDSKENSNKSIFSNSESNDKVVDEIETALMAENIEFEAENNNQQKDIENISQSIKDEMEKLEYSDVNKGIKVSAVYPDALSLANAGKYANIVNDESNVISVFVNRIKKLSTNKETSRNFLEMGETIDSSKLSRKDKLFWKETVYYKKPINLSITVLVDGSGSMDTLIPLVHKELVVLTEVFRRTNLPICIIEQRAIPGKALVENKIILSYNSPEHHKYNILDICAKGNTREGISLIWAHAFAKKNNKDRKNLLFVLSDGVPFHNPGTSGMLYTNPVNVEDMKESIKKIKKDKNTSVIALALNNNCYDELKDVYKNTILCDDMNILAKKIVHIVMKELIK